MAGLYVVASFAQQQYPTTATVLSTHDDAKIGWVETIKGEDINRVLETRNRLFPPEC